MIPMPRQVIYLRNPCTSCLGPTALVATGHHTPFGVPFKWAFLIVIVSNGVSFIKKPSTPFPPISTQQVIFIVLDCSPGNDHFIPA
jgi:hypothetical protein